MKPQHRSEQASLPHRQVHYQFHGAAGPDDLSPGQHNTVQRPPQWSGERTALPTVNVLLTLVHLDPDALELLDRGERYRLLMHFAEQQRDRIEQWLTEKELAAEVTRLGDPNTFNLLFVCCTPRVAKLLRYAPGVLDVAVAEKL